MENYKFGSVKLELGVSGYVDILILNKYPARSSSLHDNGTGNTLILYRRGEGSRSCVIGARINLCVSHMFLTFCSHFARMLLPFEGQKAHGIPFVAQMWCDLSVKVPTCGFQFKKETRWCNLSANFFHCGTVQISITKGSHVARPPCHLIIKGRCGKDIISMGFLLLF